MILHSARWSSISFYLIYFRYNRLTDEKAHIHSYSKLFKQTKSLTHVFLKGFGLAESLCFVHICQTRRIFGARIRQWALFNKRKCIVSQADGLHKFLRGYLDYAKSEVMNLGTIAPTIYMHCMLKQNKKHINIPICN